MPAPANPAARIITASLRPQDAASRCRIGTMFGVVAVASVMLASCGGSNGPSALARITGSGSSAQINALTASVEHAKHDTFKAVYTTDGAAVTIEQKPPKTLYSTDGERLIDNGTTSYTCLNADATVDCTSAPSTGDLGALAAVYSSGTTISAMRKAQSQLGARLAGYSVTFTNQSFAGLPATCMNIDSNGQTVKYCVTNSGILAYSGSAGSGTELTSYSTDVPDSDFSLPAGATLTSGP